MDYSILINKAIKKNEVLKLLRGEKDYAIIMSEFSPDVFPTDINTILVNCFYKQNENISEIKEIFINAIEALISSSSAADIYISVLYYDACIFQEERGKATFTIDKTIIANKIKLAIKEKKDDLRGEIVFCNGLKKCNALKNIENFNTYYIKKYGISVLE